MGLLSGGGGSGLKLSINNYSGTSSTFPPAEVKEKYIYALDQAKNAASTPWSDYSTDPNAFVAGTNANQQKATSNFANNVYSADPWVTQSGNYTNNAAQMYGASNQYANNANANIANYGIASMSDPYYNAGNAYTQQAGQAQGGYDYANPYMSAGSNYLAAGGQGTNQISGADIQRYLNPYQQNVVNPTLDLLKQSNEQSMQGALGNVIKNGGFGNDRAGVMMANQNQQNQLATGKTLADLNSANYQQALQTAVGQRAQNQADLQRAIAAGQGLGQIGAEQGQLRNADLARILSAGKQSADIGTAQRGAYEQQQQFGQGDLARQLAIAQQYNQNAQGYQGMADQYGKLGLARQQGINEASKQLLDAGTLQQKTDQAGKDALYNQYLQKKAYPFETSQFLMDAIGNLGPNFGSSTTDTGSSVGLSFDPWSDPSLKTGVGNARSGFKDGGADHGSSDKPEVIGRTFDGQDIYRYSLMGGPPQLGLMADEVQQRNPEAVNNLGGILTLNYAKATDHAARKGHHMGANTRPDSDFYASGGEVLDPRSPSLSAIASGPSLYGKGPSFIPKSSGARGSMPVSHPKIQAPPAFIDGKPKTAGAASQLKELAGNAHGLYQAFKGYKADGLFNGLGGVFNTASATGAAPAAATAVAEAAPAVSGAVKTTSDLGGLAKPFTDLFAANGGSIPHYYGGGPVRKKHPYEDDQDNQQFTGSIVPLENNQQPNRMPVSHPDLQKLNPQSGGGGGQQGGGGGLMDTLKGGVDLATKGIGAFKGLGQLGSAASSIGSGASSLASGAGLGAGLADIGAGAAAGAGGLEGILSFLPALFGIFSDPQLKTGVRKAYGSGGGDENAGYDPGGFDKHIGPLLKIEGGYTPNDSGAGATNKGINRRAHPNEDIEHMTDQRAGEIYKRDYWDAIGADNLPGPIRTLAFDASVNQGPARAKRWNEESGGDPQKYAQLRANHYQSLIDAHPEKYGPYVRSWAGRINSELEKQGLQPIALNYNGRSVIGHGRGPNADEALPPNARDFVATTESDPMEKVVFPLVGMAAGALAGAAENQGSGRGLGAVAGGLSGFGGAYSKIASEDLDRQKFDWQKNMDTQRLNMDERRLGFTQKESDRAEKEAARKEETYTEQKNARKKADLIENGEDGLGSTPKIGKPAQESKPTDNNPQVAPSKPSNPGKQDPSMSVTPGPNGPETKVNTPDGKDPMETVREEANKVNPPTPSVYPATSRDGQPIDWSIVPLSHNLPYWHNQLEIAQKQAKVLSNSGDYTGAEAARAKVKAATENIDKINNQGWITYPGASGGYLELPGKSDVEKRKAEDEDKRKLNYDLTKSREDSKITLNRDRAKEVLAQGDGDINSAQEVIASLDVMDNAMNNLPQDGVLSAGSFGGLRHDVAKGLNTIAKVAGLNDQFDPNSIASGEVLKKEQFRLGAALSRTIGGREPGFIVQSAVTANPGIENTPMGYRRVSSSIRSMQQYKVDRAKFYQTYFDENQTMNGAAEAFEEKNPREKYVSMAIAGAVHPQHAKEYLEATGKQKRWLGEALDETYGEGTSSALSYLHRKQ